ncbi:TIGR04076 family protein [Aminipila luticellarii]|uniref:TIGR04076 family protein n=1 Tax=Aminipila luticellarii TaxID=2507160 RepID=A0A410PVQ3_9FIRM|nr:TIGR04076 family protein [Aminipila luticellarii]QAT43013.1 TIGR04076 family protein [Aminipila luticellarii]
MAKRPKIILRMIDKKENGVCHYGHKIGDTFDFDKDRNRMCPMMVHTAFPYIDILRYGGSVPGGANPDTCKFCCPDADVINVFEIERVKS